MNQPTTVSACCGAEIDTRMQDKRYGFDYCTECGQMCHRVSPTPTNPPTEPMTTKVEPTVEKWRLNFPKRLTQALWVLNPGERTELFDYVDSLLSHSVQEAKAERDREILKMLPEEKPMGVFSFHLHGEELEQYMRFKGWNEYRGKVKDLLSTLNTKESE